jgi:hypothetical protein
VVEYLTLTGGLVIGYWNDTSTEVKYCVLEDLRVGIDVVRTVRWFVVPLARKELIEV